MVTKEIRMRTVTIQWHPDEERFTASGTHPGQVVVINAPHEPGSHHPPTGFSATELLLAGAGACSAWDVVEILKKAREPVTGVEVRVNGEQATEPPFAYQAISVHFLVRGQGLRAASVERAVRLSCERYCSILATVRGVARVVSTYEVAAPDSVSVPASAEDDASTNVPRR
jgi:putative redox protein